MQQAILEYFSGEKNAGILVAVIGAAAIAAAIVLIQPRWELKALAIVLGVLGLLELGVGIGLVIKTGPQVEGLLTLLKSDAARMQAEEAARMTRVQATFTMLQYTWVVLIAGALTVAIAMKARPT